MEADEPVAGDAVAVHFGRGKFPPTSGFQGEIGEILARAGGIEFCLGDVSCPLDVGADGDAHFTTDGAASFVGHLGQNLVQDLTTRGKGGGRFWGVG